MLSGDEFYDDEVTSGLDWTALREAARFMLDLVDEQYGTDHEPDPDNLNDAGAWEAEAEFRKHRDTILLATPSTPAEPSDPVP